MRILTFASAKGGTGKSTLAAHLAVEAERLGHGPVALVGADPQGSLAAWWNSRQAEAPQFAAVDIPQLATQLVALERQDIALVVIDTPPALTGVIARAIAVADLVCIPARPSPHDLRAVATIVEMVEHAQKPFCFVLNAATPRSTIATEAVRALAQHGKVAPVTVHQRIDFASSMIDGRTAGELHQQSRAAQEITSLWKYVQTQLRKYGGK
jgi:chromosome partitioning protein